MMHSFLFGIVVALEGAGLFAAASGEEQKAVDMDSDLRLWYSEPAKDWNEALPVGNGRLGAMVFGAPQEERLQINEDTLWTGGPHDYVRADAYKYLPEIRRLILEGKEREAEALCGAHFLGDPSRLQSYQPFVDLRIKFQGHEEPLEYRRELDLNTATARVNYRVGDAVCIREVFASYPDQVIVMRLTSERIGRYSFDVSLSSPHAGISVNGVGDNGLGIAGEVGPTKGDRGGNGKWDGPGLRFAGRAIVIPEGGTVQATPDHIEVRRADAATLLFTGATSFKNYQDMSGDPEARVEEIMARVKGKPFDQIRADHLADYQRLFHRVWLDIGKTPVTYTPTNERLANFAAGQDPQLIALYFQFGRYLLISSSREGSQPANLQGIWNDQIDPPWGSKWTTNINTEMNYWPAETCNLSECTAPLFDLIGDLAKTGRGTAQGYYQCRGWVLHHNADLWRATAPVDGPWGVWPMGAAWLCQPLWEHYAFSGDTAFLRERAYPIMKEAAEFILDFLVEAPAGSRFAGKLITIPSHSPENSYLKPSGKKAMLTYSATMDLMIINNLFAHCIAASEILGADEDFRNRLRVTLDRMVPLQAGRHGQLQEWAEDYDEPEPGHRHISHMFGVYPGEQITPGHTPELAAAARKSLDRRLENGGGGTGWSRAWLVALFARLRDGNEALRHIETLFRKSTLPNLFDNHPPFQIDGNFGATAGIAEMLIQSHEGEIVLLPALPDLWGKGAVKGLCARGNFEIDIEWGDGKLTRATVRSKNGGVCKLRYHDKAAELKTDAGESYILKGDLEP
jgi:alpha-L-fucosidase 2